VFEINEAALGEGNIEKETVEKTFRNILLILMSGGIVFWIYIFTITENKNLQKGILVILLAAVIYLGYLLKGKKNRDDKEEEFTDFIESPAKSIGRTFQASEEGREDIIIKTFPAVIGKMVTNSDYIINDSKVSRMHAKVHKEGEDYFLEDLNSTNGTYINEMRLEPYEKKQLTSGDRIKFFANTL
jgi:hypothetical protein